MPVKLYHFNYSAPSRGALLSARALGVPVAVEIVNLLKKEQLKESFLNINPQHCVPTLDDNGYILWESRAISCYLADKYGKDDQWYPKDLERRGLVNQRLYFDSSTLYVRIRAIMFPVLFLGEPEVKLQFKNDMNIALGFLDKFLENGEWVAGDNPTIADTSIYASMSNLVAIGWDLLSFPNILRWLKNCATLPGVAENDEGAKAIAQAFKKNLKHKRLFL